MIKYFLTFTPRILFDKRGTIAFRVEKRSKVKEYLDDTKEDLVKHGIACSINRTKDRKRYAYILQIFGENVFRFLGLVNDFENGKEWKQICAKRIHTLADIRKEFT